MFGVHGSYVRPLNVQGFEDPQNNFRNIPSSLLRYEALSLPFLTLSPSRKCCSNEAAFASERVRS